MNRALELTAASGATRLDDERAVGAVRAAGVSQAMLEHLQPWLGEETSQQGWRFALLTLVGSNLVGNIPFLLVASDQFSFALAAFFPGRPYFSSLCLTTR